MSLHHTIVCESPAARRWRWYAPLLLVVALTALALAPGVISGDGPHRISVCGTGEAGLDACAQLWGGVSGQRTSVR
jgi:hypothetical protein